MERAVALVDRISIHLPFLAKVRGRLSVDNVVDMLEKARERFLKEAVLRGLPQVLALHHARLTM